MKEDDVDVFSDGSTHKGNDIQRFYRYGVLTNPALTIYKPWLDPEFVEAFGGRKEMSEYLNGLGLPYRWASRRRTAPTPTASARRTRRRTSSASTRACGSSIRSWASRSGSREVQIDAGGGHRRLRARPAGQPRTASASRSRFELFAACNVVGGRHGLGMSDQIENRVIDAKSRGIYEAPGMALLHIAYERLLSAIHNENTTDQYVTLGRRLGRLLYEGKWFDPEAMMLKDALARWIAPLDHRPASRSSCAAATTTRSSRPRRRTWPTTRTSCRWRRSRASFSPEDRIGALEMQNLSVLDNRAFLINHLEATRALAAGAPPRELTEILGEGDERRSGRRPRRRRDPPQRQCQQDRHSPQHARHRDTRPVAAGGARPGDAAPVGSPCTRGRTRARAGG